MTNWPLNHLSISAITYHDLLLTLPFSNTWDCIDLKGKYIREFLEYPSTSYGKNVQFRKRNRFVSFPQVSGIKYVIDLDKPLGTRVTSLKVQCQNCPSPVYEDLDDNKMYRIIVSSFMARGGDGFLAISQNMKNRRIGVVDSEFLVTYIPKVSPINTTLEDRIKIVRGGKP